MTIHSAADMMTRVAGVLSALGFMQSVELFDNEILPSTVSDHAFALAPGDVEFDAAGGSFGVTVPMTIFLAFERRQLDYPTQLGLVMTEMERAVDALVALDEWEPAQGAPAAAASFAASARGERLVASITTRFGYSRKRG